MSLPRLIEGSSFYKEFNLPIKIIFDSANYTQGRIQSLERGGHLSEKKVEEQKKKKKRSQQ